MFDNIQAYLWVQVPGQQTENMRHTSNLNFIIL